MRPEIKAQWLEALRSGKYQQGAGRLRQGDQFCCLGILCDLAAQQSVGEWGRDDGYGVPFHVQSDMQRLVLPEDIRKWAGLPYRNPRVGETFDDGFQFTVGDFNDGTDDSIERELRPHTFTEIADLIEKYL